MYDYLDDPAPPVADDGTLAAVRARAARRRRQQVLGLSSGSAAVVAVVVAVVMLAGSPEQASLTVVTPTESAAPTPVPTPSPTVSPTVPPEPTLTATPTATPRRTTAGPTPVRSTPPAPSASPTVNCLGVDCRDGKPGWSTGYTACTPAKPAPNRAGRAPAAGVSMRLAVPAAVPAGTQVKGAVRFTNGSTEVVRFDVVRSGEALEAGVAGAGGRSSVHSSDALVAEPVELQPGQSKDLPVLARTTSCGDSPRDPETTLPAGSYVVGLTVDYLDARSGSSATGTGTSGEWSVAQDLRLT